MLVFFRFVIEVSLFPHIHDAKIYRKMAQVKQIVSMRISMISMKEGGEELRGLGIEEIDADRWRLTFHFQFSVFNSNKVPLGTIVSRQVWRAELGMLTLAMLSTFFGESLVEVGK